VGQEVTERVLRGFEKVEGFSQEEANDATKKARGLDQPWRTIAFTVGAVITLILIIHLFIGVVLA